MRKAKVVIDEHTEERINSLPLSALVFMNGYISALQETSSRGLEIEMFGKKEIAKGEANAN